MSLKITKAGLLDTLQDTGRYGYQHMGINPAGAMDRFSAQVANALLGNPLEAGVIEMHFPAAQIVFEKPAIIAITGADLSPRLNKKNISIGQPVAVKAGTILDFEKKISGARCYLAVSGQIKLPPWLNSYSTNLVAAAGGYNGRALKKGDVLDFENRKTIKEMRSDHLSLPWRSSVNISMNRQVRFTKGHEWEWLAPGADEIFTGNEYSITAHSNRMGYRLEGKALQARDVQLVSSAVGFGTVQLLPDGQLIILMADHQTTGGYPRLAQVISADLCTLAQCNTADRIKFVEVDMATAEQAFIGQQRDILQMQTAAKFKIEEYAD